LRVRAFENHRRSNFAHVALKAVDIQLRQTQSLGSLFVTMLASPLPPPAIANGSPTILQFPSESPSGLRLSRPMTTQLLQDAAKVIPNQQLLINVVSKRVRQLGLGHRPMVDPGVSRGSLTDIALKEIIAGKLTYEEIKDPKTEDGA
jgi:DNA-directed RNA polymerase subunit omega